MVYPSASVGGFFFDYLYIVDVNQRGCIGEHLFAVECMRKGYEVSMPLLDASIYDCIVDTGDRLIKVQIKTTAKIPINDSKNIHVPIQNNKNKDYPKSRVDFFAVWSSFFGGFFIFENIGNMSAVRISLDGKNSKYFNNFGFE